MTGGRPVGQVRRAPYTVPTLQHRHRDPELGRILPGLGGHGTPRQTQRSDEEREHEGGAAWKAVNHNP